MPYIKKEARRRLEEEVREYGHALPETPGELNYLFTQFALAYVMDNGEGYQAFNDVIGALEGCKLELYRRQVVPFEDAAIERNGDVGV